MSGEKIDLAAYERKMRAKAFMGDSEGAIGLALVRAVRAARAFHISRGGEGYAVHVQRRNELHAALAPFTDSAEVRSDEE